MPINSKQRAQLRGMAMELEPVVQVGKEGLTPAVIESVSDVLRTRELIKGHVLESCMLSAREVCDLLAEACKAEPVQVIGTRFVLYKRNEKKPKIELVKASKK